MLLVVVVKDNINGVVDAAKSDADVACVGIVFILRGDYFGRTGGYPPCSEGAVNSCQE